MQTNRANNPKFDDWVYLISVLTGPLTVMLAAIIALTASTSLVKNDTRARELMQFSTLLLTGGAAVTGTTHSRRLGTTNVAMGKDVNVKVEEQPGTTNTNYGANSWDGRTVVQSKEDRYSDFQTSAEPSVENVELPPEGTLKGSASSLQETSAPLPAQNLPEANGIGSPRIRSLEAVDSNSQSYDTQP